jgi:hypothetical protein
MAAFVVQLEPLAAEQEQRLITWAKTANRCTEARVIHRNDGAIFAGIVRQPFKSIAQAQRALGTNFANWRIPRRKYTRNWLRLITVQEYNREIGPADPIVYFESFMLTCVERAMDEITRRRERARLQKRRAGTVLRNVLQKLSIGNGFRSFERLLRAWQRKRAMGAQQEARNVKKRRQEKLDLFMDQFQATLPPGVICGFRFTDQELDECESYTEVLLRRAEV